MVDAKHAMAQLDEHHEAQEQVGFADRILVSKTGLVAEIEAAASIDRLRHMNVRAPIATVHFGKTPIQALLDIRGFNLDAILAIEPDFLSDVSHEHDDDVTSFAFGEKKPLDLDAFEDFMGGVIRAYGAKLLRYKGILNAKGSNRRIVFQGVHMMMSSEYGSVWKNGETRESKLVFIAKNLPKDVLLGGLAQCVAGARPRASAPSPA